MRPTRPPPPTDEDLLELALGGLAPINARVRIRWGLEAVAIVTDGPPGMKVELIVGRAPRSSWRRRLAGGADARAA